jgi:hypothetical protein
MQIGGRSQDSLRAEKARLPMQGGTGTDQDAALGYARNGLG